jgi:hypothetical protein
VAEGEQTYNPAPSKKPSAAWYLLPIFFTWLGGLIGYFVLRKDHPEFAKKILIVGLIMTVVWIAVVFVSSYLVSILAYSYLTGVLQEQTSGSSLIDVVDTTCLRDQSYIVTVRNLGTSPVEASELSVTVDDVTVNPTWNPQTIASDGTSVATIDCDSQGVACDSGSVHIVKVTGRRTLADTVIC